MNWIRSAVERMRQNSSTQSLLVLEKKQRRRVRKIRLIIISEYEEIVIFRIRKDGSELQWFPEQIRKVEQDGWEPAEFQLL